MKKILISILFLTSTPFVFAQNGRTAYIDIYQILKKSPEYTEANLELEKRVKDWQSQIVNKKAEITKMKDALTTERALLTSQLIEEKEDEIRLVEAELNVLQQEKFGTDGDYFNQHQNIYKPILDQIHTITNDIATKKKLDVVLIKGDGNTMVYANKRNDITDLVLKEMERSRSRGKLSKKEIAALEAQDKIEESKERAKSKRDLLKERQKDLESGNLITSNTNETSSESAAKIPNETEAEKRLRINQERIEAAKKQQEEKREQQLKKLEEQKLALKQKQEQLKAQKEQAIKDAIDKKNNTNKNNATSSQNNNKQLSEKQQEMLALRNQRAKEAKEKRDKTLQERKQAMEKRKQDAKKAQEERLKKIQEDKDNRLKESQKK